MIAVDVCCRDLKQYLQHALASAKGGVISVKLRRLLRAELTHSDRMKYAKCLHRILAPWRWRSMYVIPRQAAEQMLKSLDRLCTLASAKRRRRRLPNQPRAASIAVRIPAGLLHAVDAYAQHIGTTRSVVIRYAVQQLTATCNALKEPDETDEMRDGPMKFVTFRLPVYMLDALEECAKALNATRSELIRHAIVHILRTQRLSANDVAPFYTGPHIVA